MEIIFKYVNKGHLSGAIGWRDLSIKGAIRIRKCNFAEQNQRKEQKSIDISKFQADFPFPLVSNDYK